MATHSSGTGDSPSWLRAWPRLPDEEQGVEHDRFSERDGQDRLDHHRRRGAGIASHCFRSFRTDEANREGSANGRETDVQVAAHVLLTPFLLPTASTVGAVERLSNQSGTVASACS